jgi:hypothetical protein
VLLAAAMGAGPALGLLGTAPAPAAAAALPASLARPAAPVPVAAAAPAPPSGATQITLPAGPGTDAPGAAAPTKLSGRAKAAAVLGGLLLIGVLWAFSQGFGILGGRARRRRPPGVALTPARDMSTAEGQPGPA